MQNHPLNPNTKVAYLGPRGTYSEQIALHLYHDAPSRLHPYQNIHKAIKAVQADEVVECVVPLENSIEGSVSMTLDALAHEVELYIVKEIILPVSHYLLVKSLNAPIDMVISHPQALAQCRDYIDQHYPNSRHMSVESTATAAAMVAAGPETQAAIAGHEAAKLYNLTIADSNIQDNPNNCTRFIVLKKHPIHPTEPPIKTSIICQLNGDRPGGLCELLQEFAQRDVNLTKIESRPTRTGLGNYLFFLDIAGSLTDPAIQSAVEAVRTKCLWFKSLGSYPSLTLAAMNAAAPSSKK